MDWDRVVLCAKDFLGLVLVARLFVLQLQGVYRVFSLFVFYECGASSLILFQPPLDRSSPSYHREWLALSGVGWIVDLWMVYALLDAVLARLPGILSFSRRFLQFAFLGAVIVALITAKPELAGSAGLSARGLLDSAVALGMALERVISTVVLLVMLAIFCFVLWFPVRMPKNLVVFGLGLVVYFSFRNVLMLAQEFLPPRQGTIAAQASMLILAACFIYWTICLSRLGESVELRVGHSWKVRDQQRLVEQLEAMNAALLRSTRTRTP